MPPKKKLTTKRSKESKPKPWEVTEKWMSELKDNEELVDNTGPDGELKDAEDWLPYCNKNDHEADVDPGPQPGTKDVFYVDAVYGCEVMFDKEKPYLGFYVQWSGYPADESSIEPLQHLMNTREGQTVTRKSLKEISPEEMQFRKDFMSHLSIPDDIDLGDNDYQMAANEILRRNRSEDKYCAFIGFFGPNSESNLVFQYEIDFWKEVCAKWTSLGQELKYDFYTPFIGSKPKELNGKGYDKSYIDGVREFYNYNPTASATEPHLWARRLRNRMAKGHPIHFGNGTETGGRQCMRSDIMFIGDVLANVDWYAKYGFKPNPRK
ncbi:unnamed protein product [Oppiella nova]|uniref:Chromo domain-containing protein n=1 Tax=Oppiella nova TaxID=334625 RepID=A0A7R9LZV5_9ACAR|nr:unnamed protein product [Oppiella nova]CAG2167919.1 unnamed protein product [Oppiella nova]